MTSLALMGHKEIGDSRRPNTAREDWLAVSLRKGLKLCETAREAHEEAEGADCECALHRHLRTLHYNLSTAEACVTGQVLMVSDERHAELEKEIDRRTRLEPAANSRDLDQLLRVLWLTIAACSDVLQEHNGADQDGFCGCWLCDDVFGISVNLEMGRQFTEDALQAIEHGRGLPAGPAPAPAPEPVPDSSAAPADTPADAAHVIASADLTTARKRAAAPAPAPARPIKTRRNYWEPSDD